MRGCLTPDSFSRQEYPSVCESAKIFRNRSTDVCFSTAWHRRNLYWLSGGTESRGQFQTKKRERAKPCVIETQRNFTSFQSIALTTHRAAKKFKYSITYRKETQLKSPQKCFNETNIFTLGWCQLLLLRWYQFYTLIVIGNIAFPVIPLEYVTKKL